MTRRKLLPPDLELHGLLVCPACATLYALPCPDVICPLCRDAGSGHFALRQALVSDVDGYEADPAAALPGSGLPDAELACAEALALDATPGPWRWQEKIGGRCAIRGPLAVHGLAFTCSEEDARFIAAARSAVPALAAEVRRLRLLLAHRARTEELHP